MNWNGILIGSGLIALYLLARRSAQLTSTSAKLESNITRIQIDSLSLAGLAVRLDAKLKNPTRTSFNMSFPFVKLLYGGSSIGSSTPVNKIVSVPAYGEVVISDIVITIPPLNVLSAGYTLIKSLLSGQAMKVGVYVSTDIDMGVAKYAFEKIEDVTLNPKA